MQRYFLVLLLAPIALAQTFNPSGWDNGSYGLPGGYASNSFCHQLIDKGPAGGPAPTVKEATQSAVCAAALSDLVTGRLMLIDDLKIKIGAPEAKTAVVPLTGSFTLYRCEYLPMAPGSVGKNCSSAEFPKAEGSCKKDASGRWACKMNYGNPWELKFTHEGVPPPEAPPSAAEAESVFYAVKSAPDGPFATTAQPLDKQACKATRAGTRITCVIEGTRAAVRFKADSSLQFRIKPNPEAGRGMLIRFTIENGTRIMTIVEENGKITAVEGSTAFKTWRVGPSVKISPPTDLPPGEYGLFWETLGTASLFGID
jgi:hypothetical protein